MKIVIAGIGGVGGYFGGLLARRYRDSETGILFIARGAHENAIRNDGLKLETSDGNFVVHPAGVFSNPVDAGAADIILFCTKSYDLEDTAMACKPIVNSGTVLLPLLNGVDATDRLQKIFRGNEVWNGCVYLVSRLAAPGLIRESGNIRKLFFGAEKGSEAKLLSVEKILRDAGIDATWSKNINEKTWEKFLFISPMATLTSFLDKSIGAVFADAESRNMLELLLLEIKAVADAKKILLPELLTQQNIDKLKSLPKDATTSMHRDFKKGGRTELESLTGYVIREAKRMNVPVPTYEMIYERLKLPVISAS
jgi:2-dehydropantoate 2-reductase